jgi:Zn-dependent M28 family amino/carboxypeptidase
MKRWFSLAGVNGAVVIALAACSTASAPTSSNPFTDPALQPALNSVTSEGLLASIKVLASDDFEGRLPGTHGEDMTVNYIADRFKAIGLAPGNPDGTYIQNVPFVGIASKVSASFNVAGKAMPLELPKDMVAFSPRAQNRLAIENSDLVFVGYGVIAPEYNWDDYKGMDVRGKTLLMLINDPQIPDPKDPSKLDDSMFKGNAMTYYGRWTYKYEIAAKLGARAAIIIHETKPAAYPYEVVVNSWSRENFSIKTVGPNPDFPDVASWIHLDKAKQLFSASGYDFAELKRKALSRDFKPVALPATVSFHVQNAWREVASRNVVAKLEGSDPALKNEYVVYSAHWDHLGIDLDETHGSRHDRIYHGAIDNASGVADLLSFANAYAQLRQRPKRSILFIATTGEEQGLLGAKYYANHPLYPLSRTLADINVDTISQWGRTRDVAITGYGMSALDDLITGLAAEQGRTVKPDPKPENGYFYRADQFEFAKLGVPVMYAKSGNDLIDKPAGTGEKLANEFIANNYHKPSDEIMPAWDLSGAVEDARLLIALGYVVAQSPEYPRWKPGAEFKAARDKMMAP